MSKQKALELLADFDTVCWAAAFPNIEQQTLVEGLRIRINDPVEIDQNGANLCGPAAFVYDLAVRDPVTYTQFVLDLYRYGKATIKKFVINPSRTLKNYKIPASNSAPHPADWIPMASIRNSKGSFVFWDRYDNVNDAASGITRPAHLRNWLKDVGYAEVIDKTAELGLTNAQAKKLLQEAVDKDNAGYKVFLLILAELLNGFSDSKQTKKDDKGNAKKASKSLGTFPNHWVILESGVVSTTTAKLTVYSWGGFESIPPAGENWTLDQIAARYYGYIAGRF